MEYQWDVFISYSSHDKQWVLRLVTALRARGVNVWWDEALLSGEGFVPKIEKAIESSRAMLVVVSKASSESPWVKEEYAYALRLDIAADRMRLIIPLKIDSTKILGFLGGRQYISFEKDEEFDLRVSLLVDRLHNKHPSISDLGILQTLPSLDKIIRTATESIIISGHTLDKFSTDAHVNTALHECFELGKRMTLILVNPFCNYAKAHEPFHLLESHSPSSKQIMGTISTLKSIVTASASSARQFNVLLSNYMPRFRTILVDDSIMYISLYIYGEDVGAAPEVMLRASDQGTALQWFGTIRESLNKLRESTDVTYLIKEGQYNEEWESIRIRDMIIHCPGRECCRNPANCWDEVRHVILGYPKEGVHPLNTKYLVPHDQEPGTYKLSEISADSEFLDKRIHFDDWLHRVYTDELKLIKSHYPRLLVHKDEEEIFNQLKSALCFVPPIGNSLINQIWIQEYSDIIRRFIYTILAGDPELNHNLYPELTYAQEDFILRVIAWIEREKQPDLKSWLHLSVAAGLLGIDVKPNHAATSEINRKFAIALVREGEDIDLAVHRVANALWKAAKSPCRIDASEAFLSTMEIHKGTDASIVSFPDDYLETIVLLKYYQELLRSFPRLRINCVPRSARCSNDANYQDVVGLVQHFPNLNNNPKFVVHGNGPKIGGINPHKLHPDIIRLIDEAVAIDVRGARSYEMMQGIYPETYFGFMVCREISESVIGYPAKKKPFVYIRQKGGQHSFQGFRSRHLRMEDGIKVAEVAAKDNAAQWEGGHLAKKSDWSNSRRERFRILHEFYGQNALNFRNRFGALLEQEVRDTLDRFRGRVLVLGCGSGKEVKFLSSRHQCDVWGTDFSPEAIAIARGENNELRHRFILEDLYNLDYILKSDFDGIVANAVLLHLLHRDDLFIILQKMFNRLKPGGIAFIRIIEKEGYQEEMDDHLFSSKRWFVYYTQEEFTVIAERAGFVIDELLRYPHSEHRTQGVYWIHGLIRRPLQESINEHMNENTR